MALPAAALAGLGKELQCPIWCGGPGWGGALCWRPGAGAERPGVWWGQHEPGPGADEVPGLLPLLLQVGRPLTCACDDISCRCVSVLA